MFEPVNINRVTEERLGEVKKIVRGLGYRGKVKAARDLTVIKVGEIGDRPRFWKMIARRG